MAHFLAVFLSSEEDLVEGVVDLLTDSLHLFLLL
jgi:hypothetical protein